MKFRKKPVVIEAFQWEPEARAGFAPNWFYEGCAKRALCPEFNGTLTVYTLEGAMRADPGDWIIKGVAGEFYPCKPDIFAATYEPVSDDAPSAPQAGPKREPLSDEQVLILLRSLAPDVTANLRGYTAIVRAVERHHGIGDSDAE